MMDFIGEVLLYLTRAVVALAACAMFLVAASALLRLTEFLCKWLNLV